jgi:integrase
VAVDALRWHRTRQEADRPVAGAGYGDYDSGGSVFAGPTDSPLRGDTVNKRWHRALRRVGRPPLRLHDARHSAATFWLVDADVPLRVVSDLSGHSTVKLLADRYSHVLPAHLRQSAAAARLAKHGQNTDSPSRAAT